MPTSDGSISYNSEKLDSLASTLNDNYKSICSEVENIISEAEGLSSSGLWTGEMYEAFLTNIKTYKVQNIDPLLDVIEKYIDQIRNAAEQTRRTTAEGVARFQV